MSIENIIKIVEKENQVLVSARTPEQIAAALRYIALADRAIERELENDPPKM